MVVTMHYYYVEKETGRTQLNFTPKQLCKLPNREILCALHSMWLSRTSMCSWHSHSYSQPCVGTLNPIILVTKMYGAGGESFPYSSPNPAIYASIQGENSCIHACGLCCFPRFAFWGHCFLLCRLSPFKIFFCSAGFKLCLFSVDLQIFQRLHVVPYCM